MAQMTKELCSLQNQSRGKEIASAPRSEMPGRCPLKCHTRCLLSELCWLITCNVCHRLGPEWRGKPTTKPCQKLQTDYTIKSKPAGLNLSIKKLFSSSQSCLSLWPPPPSPRGSPKPPIQV